MVSILIDAEDLGTFFVLKYCMISQIYSKSVYCSISATLQGMSCISSPWERRRSLPIECL